MNKVKFTKMHGCGNDFILIDDRDDVIPEEEKGELARFLSQRNFSVGADGVLYLCRPTIGSFDVRMRVFNPDGSEAEMCGNGIRCFAKYIYEKGVLRSKILKVETLAGLILPEVEVNDEGIVTGVRVFMGKPIFDKIDEVFYVNAEIGEVRLTTLSIGNPHAVLIIDTFEGLDVDRIGKAIESHKAFPNRTNVTFVVIAGNGKKVEGKRKENEISVRTYERGIGETLSCGTGAVASVLALNVVLPARGVQAGGYGNIGEQVMVHTKGGDLVVEVREEGAYLTGPAEKVYEGVVPACALRAGKWLN